MQRRCDRNRKRSKRRAIYCPIHKCSLNSVSPKCSLFADSAQQLQQRGVGRKPALILIATEGTISLKGEWLEAFWCEHCQGTKWYHVQKTGDRTYHVSVAPQNLWEQATGVIHPDGNPSVGEFTRRHARMAGHSVSTQFKFLN